MRLSAWNQPLMVLALNLVTVVVDLGRRRNRYQSSPQPRHAGSSYHVCVTAGNAGAHIWLCDQLVLARASPAGIRVFGVLDEQPEIKDAPDAHVLERVEGHVQLEHVNFAYGDRPAKCCTISTSMRSPARSIAIAGRNGQRQKHDPAPAAALL